MESLFKLGILLRVMDMVSGPVQAISKSIDGLASRAEKLQPTFDKFKDYGRWIAGAGVAGALGLGIAVTQFANLEEAQLRLRTTLMDAAGVVGPEYAKLNALAEKLGTDLPGSTKDMIQMFIALREQGVQTNRILGGTGEAAAKFAALMKLGFSESATHVAKFSESMGVVDDDMVKFMDLLQRLKYASGIEVGDLAYTFKYAGGALKLLGLQGLDSAKDFSVIVGMLAAAGIEGSTAGTNMAQAFSRMAEIGHRLDKGMVKKLVGPILDKYSIKLNFFSSTGEFLGLRPMVAELEKLKALNPQEQIITLKKLFGDEAARPLAVLLKSGVAGYDQMLDRIRQQADMQRKITEIMGGAKMQWETLSGTIANVVAHTGAVVARVVGLIGIMKLINDLAGKLDAWILANPTTAGIIGGIVVTVTALALAAGGLLLAIGLGGTLITKMVVGFGMLSKAFLVLRMGLVALVPAVWSFTTALLANPVTWVVGAVIAVVAALAWLSKRFEGVNTAIQFFNFFLGWLLGNLAKLATINGWLSLFKSGRALVSTLVDGIKSMAMGPVNAIKDIFLKVRNLLPFSDAKEGPLSRLTLSGERIMTTMGEGIAGAAPGLQRTMANALAGAALTASIAMTANPVPAGAAPLVSAARVDIPAISLPRPIAAQAQPATGKPIASEKSDSRAQGKQVVIQQMTVQISNVSDAKDFIKQLQAMVEGYDVD